MAVSAQSTLACLQRTDTIDEKLDFLRTFISDDFSMPYTCGCLSSQQLLKQTVMLTRYTSTEKSGESCRCDLRVKLFIFSPSRKCGLRKSAFFHFGPVSTEAMCS